jgi:hypothetical protein
MKRILFLIALTASLHGSAQFFQGWGLMGGATYANQRWKNSEVGINARTKYLLRWNAEAFAEFGEWPFVRWVTEVQYNNKGAKTKLLFPSSLEGADFVKYKNSEIAWNNYLMIRKEMLSIIPYVKIGPRAEYVLSSDQSFRKFHITASAGAGVEFVSYGNIRFLTEFHYVPDLTKSYDTDPLRIKQNAMELRIGLKFVFAGGGEACPPVYK